MTELTPEQLRLEQERLKVIQDQNTAAKDLLSHYEMMRKSIKGISKEDKEILDISKQLKSITGDIEKSINMRISGTASIKDFTKQIKTLSQQQLNTNNELDKLQTAYVSKLNTARKERQEIAKHERNLIETQEKLGQNASRVANIQHSINAYNDQLIAAQGRGDRNEIQRLSNLKRRAIFTQNMAKNKIREAKEEFNDYTKMLEQEKKKYGETSKSLKLLYKSKEAYKEVIEAREKELGLLEQAKTQKQKEAILNVIKKQFRWEEIKDMLTIAGIAKIILDAALRFSAISTQIGKGLGYSADEANRVTKNLVSIAQNSGDVNITLKNAAEAMNELNAATGGVAEYSASTLMTQIMLTKQFGLTGEQAAGIYRLSILTGKSSDEVNKAMIRGFVSSRNQLRTSADFKVTMAAASIISGQLAMNLKNSPESIVKAVVATQALGSSLEQAKKQGESLLNWESSIENELKAELLTGQQINLERARAAALMGDQVTVAKELASQGITIEKFQNMNVLAQKSFAEALGLSSDELSDQLRKQKIAQEQGKSLAQITEEDAVAAQKRQNIQDKFNAAIEKLQDLLGNLVAGPVAKLLSFMTNILSSTYALSAIMSVYIGKLVYSLAVKTASWLISKKETQNNLVNASLTAAQSAAKVPVIGAALGIAAGLATFAAFSGIMSKVGDMYSPADGKTQVSTKEGGLFELSPNDDLIAAPGLSKKGTNMSGPSLNIEPLILAINNVRAAVDKLYAKEGIIYLDGNKVGTALMQGSYKSA